MLYTGVVENRYDPLKLGRVQVRVVGLHTHDVNKLPTGDLPWAVPVQSITSAAVSGIGQSPLGLIEGSWVIVMFTDEDNQYPVILGSIAGIPQRNSNIASIDSSVSIKIDGELRETNTQTETVVDPQVNILEETEVPTNKNALKRAAEFTVSNNCVTLIKRFEGLRLKSYQDSVGIWTIGYGTTRINGEAVQPGMVITEAQAQQYLLSDIESIASAPVKRNTRALISQSMFDALCCFTYNVGPGNFAKSTLLKDVNAGKYLDAAAGFMQWTQAGGVELSGLVKRRTAEKDLFLAEGIPNIAGELPVQPSSSSDSVVVSNTTASNSIVGFADPNGKYPLYFDEPDTNRLARHEEINKTIVYSKEAAIDEGVATANGQTWDQSPIPYNAQYPFNHVMQTESGHVLEFDDTPNSERVHIYHKSGTFTEIDANGTQVNRIVGDGYEILERNGYVHINGSLNVTVDGAQNVLVKNTYNLNVTGTTTISVHSDANISVAGNMIASVGESFRVKAAEVFIEGDNVNIKSNGEFKIHGSSMDIKSDSSYNMEGGGDVSVLAGGVAKVDGSRVDLGMGANSAADAESTGIGESLPRAESEMPEFNKLTVITRGSSAAGQYETPDEGDPTIYQQKQVNTGAIKSEEIGVALNIDRTSVASNNVVALPKTCDVIALKQNFDPSFQLSKNYTLNALTTNGSRMPVAQQGISVQEIVCNLKGLCENVLEPIRAMYPNLLITSAFRRPGDVAGSSKTSDHYLGCAVDIVIPNLDRAGHYQAIQKIQQMVPYDQLILEYQGSRTVWIHISFKYKSSKNQTFTMKDHKRISDFGQFTLVA
jgi:GH24 family phage-related lysozyme (muramidase)